MAALAAIGIICKAPRAGHSKTRLAAVVGADQAAQLAACFLRDLSQTIDSVRDDFRCRGYAVYAPAGAEADIRKLLPASFDLLLQADSAFENVLFGATRDLLAAGHDCVLLVNGDSPTLPPSLLSSAIGSLRQPGDRVVLGPASDGGYYLIGLKTPHRHLFTDIPWGTASVAQRTVDRASEIGLETVCLSEWYDVDDGETLQWLRTELDGRSRRFVNGAPAAATRTCLAAMTSGAQ